MKKIILFSAIVISTLVACSTDELSTYETNKASNKTVLSKENDSDFCITCRDSITRDQDTIMESVNPKPIKP